MTQAAWAQSSAQPETDTLRVSSADTTERLDVYETKRTTTEKVLAFPSNVLHAATRPIGEVVIWAERNEIPTRVRDVFWNETHTFGVFPVARLGGSTVGAAGLAVRHERLFGTPREAKARFLFSNRENLRVDLSYENPAAPFGEASFVNLDVAYRTDSDENLFLTRNLGVAGGETSYEIEEADVRLSLGADPRARVGIPGMGWRVRGRYENVEIGRGDGEGARRFPATLPGVGTAQLLTTGASALLDMTQGRKEGQPRTTTGRRLLVAYDYTTNLSDEPFSYHRLLGEWQRFMPLSFLGPYRRLAFRARLEKLFPAPGKAIPFYRLATLGNADYLRGFEQNRFRGEGALLFTLEYRYPVWTTWDALLFVDSGQTFDAFDEIAPADFRWSAGFGIRVYAGSSVSLRLDVGFSEDGVRAFSETGSSFTVSTRR